MAAEAKKHGLSDVVKALGQPRVAGMLALGFSSGLPFLLTGGTFGYWLADEGASRTAIGFLSWVGLAYTFKYLWAPIVDRLPAPFLEQLGRRRGWAVVVQILLAAALVVMALIGPHGPGGLITIGALALVVAFASATQDIVLDAWRIESATDSEELGLYTSSFQLGYRIALLVTDALILIFAQHIGWPLSYGLMAIAMGVGMFAALRTPEPPRTEAPASPRAASATTAEIPSWRVTAAGAAFLIAAVWMYAVTHWWLAEGADPAKAGQAGLVLTAVFAACAGLCAARLPRFAALAGGVAIVLLVIAAFYSAATESHLLGGAEMFLPAFVGGIAAALVAPQRVYDGVIGPFLEFVRAHGLFALVILLMISLYRLPEFVIGPVAGPFYHDLGLEKDVVGGVRASAGLIASIAGIAAGGLAVLRLGLKTSLVIGAVLQGLGVAAFSLLAIYGADLRLFAFAMACDNFSFAFAGVGFVAYMSSLTSLGYTATQYAFLSSLYTIFGKFLKGFSGAVVDGIVAQGRTLMDAYAMFYIGAGLICIPALVLTLVIATRPVRAPAEEAAAA